MNDVTKGFRAGRFGSLPQRDQEDILKLMARVGTVKLAESGAARPDLRWPSLPR